ncbi:MAG: sortase [Bacilli bacterium]|nr:sortase [Bacilli bacterium]
MVKKSLNFLIFMFIFSLYFFSFLMIYDTFRERKLVSLESDALDVFENEIKNQETNPTTEETGGGESGGIAYQSYTILGSIDIPKIGFSSIILKEFTYDAMNVGTIKSFGSELNEPGGFVIVGHNFRGRSLFMYNVHRLVGGDKIYITDTSGRQVEYTVYEVLRYVAPDDISSYTTYDGLHATLITCEDGGKTRIVVKASAQ